METLLQAIANVVVYPDNILITGPTEEAHLKSTNQNGTSRVMSKEEQMCFYGRFSHLPRTQKDTDGLHLVLKKLEPVQCASKLCSVSELKTLDILWNVFAQPGNHSCSLVQTVKSFNTMALVI